MSTTYDLVCDDCKECIWIGQGITKTDHYIYTTDYENIKEFLYDHQGHNLRYLSCYAMTEELCEYDIEYERVN